jgi:hypothetical protein
MYQLQLSLIPVLVGQSRGTMEKAPWLKKSLGSDSVLIGQAATISEIEQDARISRLQRVVDFCTQTS